jgi:hypothetical protein
MMSTADNFQKEVDRWFLDASKLGWDDVTIRRKVEDILRKSRYDDPTKYRRILFTICKMLPVKLDDRNVKNITNKSK